MIPKIIHYCWFGGKPLPSLAVKCIESWKKYFPTYEIKEWNEDNFDVNITNYTRQAYDSKKYAFVSDYVRFYVLYKYGGVYFDTDVEIIKSFNDILNRGPFMGCENDINEGLDISVAPGLGLAVEKGNHIYKEILDLYGSLSFIEHDKLVLKTVVQYTTEILNKHGLKKINALQNCDGIWIYPKEYFNPISHVNEIIITPNTYSIHHYAGSWLPKQEKFKTFIIKLLGRKIWRVVITLRKMIYK